MSTPIVTIVSQNYCRLLPFWLEAAKKFVPTETILVISSDRHARVFCEQFKNDRQVSLVEAFDPHYLSISEPLHAAGLKLLLFEHLDSSIERVMFLDIDAFAVQPLPTRYFETSDRHLRIAVDYYPGYKERLKAEFEILDPTFEPKFFPDGRRYYFNTGVFFAHRDSRPFFRLVLQKWHRYRSLTGRTPSILDQNIFNFCLVASNMSVVELPVHLNWLRSYAASVTGGKVFSTRGQSASVVHMNGGSPEVKEARYRRLLGALARTSHDSEVFELEKVLDGRVEEAG